ncbi:MAG: TFIIB-type zinc ribbon-containing protein [Clostridia bacterium]|nr:TFIIB-type zinc ribbon-containing protein [Clostridia bacterium]
MAELERTLKATEKDTFTAKCENCGGNMVFNPETQELYCEYCGSSKDFAKSKEVSEINIADAFKVTELWEEENVTYRCENCGAVVVMPSTQVATLCPYCSTAHVVKSIDSCGLKPNAIYPFTIGKTQAESFAKAWAKKRFFAPRKFKKELNADKLQGVYEPAFTYDTKTYSTYHGVIGIRRSRTVGSGKNRRVVTYIDWHTISGTYSYSFDDVTVTASETNTQQAMNKLMPYDINDIKVYDKTYLSGFMAHKTSKTVNEGWETAKSIIDDNLRKLILSNYHYHVVQYLNVNTVHEGVTYKYVLLPTYAFTYPYKNKSYQLFVNGNTGKVAGKTPVSPWKVALVTVLGIALVALLAFLFTN